MLPVCCLLKREAAKQKGDASTITPQNIQNQQNSFWFLAQPNLYISLPVSQSHPIKGMYEKRHWMFLGAKSGMDGLFSISVTCNLRVWFLARGLLHQFTVSPRQPVGPGAYSLGEALAQALCGRASSARSQELGQKAAGTWVVCT